ncbi:hypothetical protein Tco_0800725 [Tanacetum coccineum]|uniref:Uncharacterized protein n=1 Tax=Tanacetum coccineum TaxID=301880 RepID=A0ABQ4ZXA6_9ASTR
MSGEEPAPQMAPVESPQMISTVKLPILKKDENGVETEVPPKTAQAILARQKERKAKSILLLAIPDEYQLRFHTIKDAKSLWAAIKSRFGGNVESKKIQKNVLKQQFKNFFVSDTEGLDKAYDRFQKLISQLEVHGAAVSNEDANQKFLRALPSSWNNIALIMRNKEGIDELDIDDLYNNLKVFKADIKGSSGSSSNSHNVAFLFAKDTNSINEVNTANSVSTATGHNSQVQASSSSYTNDLMECRAPRNQRNRNGDAGYRNRDNTRRIVPVETSDALVVQDNALIVQDGLGYDWSYITQNEPIEFALMAYTSGSDTKVQSYSKNCLESVEAQLIVYQKNEVVYEEKIAILEFEVKDKDKIGSGYGDQLNESDSEVINSIFDSRSSDGDDNQINDRNPFVLSGEYSQWRERFMNYLEEQTDGEAMINSIQNGDHPLPVVAQVSLAGTAPNAPPTLKDPKFWTAEEKKNRKIDRLARSLLIQGLPNDILFLYLIATIQLKYEWNALIKADRGF